MLRPHSIVIAHLNNPSEKLWGVLEALDLPGFTLRGINLSSFDEWMLQAARNEPQSLGLVTMFVPMFRVERLFLDETVGAVESYRSRFQQRVGRTVEDYLELPTASPSNLDSIPS